MSKQQEESLVAAFRQMSLADQAMLLGLAIRRAADQATKRPTLKLIPCSGDSSPPSRQALVSP